MVWIVSDVGRSHWTNYTRKQLFLKGLRGFCWMWLEVDMAERVGFEPTWELSPPNRFRVGAVMTASSTSPEVDDS